MRDWRARLQDRAASQAVVMITVLATEGSVPREVGARMLVAANGAECSIGGGQLEFQAIARARALLDAGEALTPWYRETQRVILGPDTNQCCGGVVELLYEVFTPSEAAMLARFAEDAVLIRPVQGDVPPQATANALRHGGLRIDGGGDARVVIESVTPALKQLFLYGAGHVARSLVRVLHGLPFAITWIDQTRDRFPDVMPSAVNVVVTEMPHDRAARALAQSLHLVMTHSHDLDFDICRALLARGDLRFVGLIGSTTKRARFAQRFKREGLSDDAIARLVCPIGQTSIKGKAPEVIAISVAAQLLSLP